MNLRSAIPHVPAITGLRFVAAGMVLLAHAFPVVQFPSNYSLIYLLYGLGGTGMALFFTLSGFVMWVNYADVFSTASFRSALKGFAVARFARLYPLYLWTLMLALAIAPAIHGTLAPFPLMLQSWFPATDGELWIFAVPRFAHSWSLSVELALYVIFPLIFLAFRKPLGSRIFLLLLAVTMTFGVVLQVILGFTCLEMTWWSTLGVKPGDGCRWLTYYSPLTHFFEFFGGMMAAAAFSAWHARSINSGERRLSLLLAAVAVFTAACSSYLRAVSALVISIPMQSVAQAMLLPSMTLIVFYLARYPSKLQRVLSTRPVVFGGEISYSVYLLHPFIIHFFIMPPVADMTLANLVYWAIVVGAAICTTILGALITYYLIEVPGRRWLRSVLGNPSLGTQPTNSSAIRAQRNPLR